MIKIVLSKATNGFIITCKIEINITTLEKTAVFYDIDNALNCFRKLNEITNSGRMTILEFVDICSDNK